METVRMRSGDMEIGSVAGCANADEGVTEGCT